MKLKYIENEKSNKNNMFKLFLKLLEWLEDFDCGYRMKVLKLIIMGLAGVLISIVILFIFFYIGDLIYILTGGLGLLIFSIVFMIILVSFLIGGAI